MRQQPSEAVIDLSEDLVVRTLDDAALALYGVEAGRARGRHLGEVLLTDSGRIDWDRHFACVRQGLPFAQVLVLRSVSGLRVWVAARLEAVPGGARLCARRATGLEVVEQLPGGAVDAYTKMLAVGGVGLWMDDRLAGEFVWSPRALELHDFAPDAQVTPAMLFGNIHPDERGTAAADIQRCVAEHVPYDGVLRVQRKDGGYRHLRVFGGATYDRDGSPLVAVGGVLDLSQEVALRARVRELEDQLAAAQRGDVVGRLVGGIAHDFNNILTGILGCCEMLSSAELPDEQQGDVQQIRGATLRAAELTRQLLAFGRRQALRRRPLAPDALVRDVLGLLRRTVPANIELSMHVEGTPGLVLADATQLHQVITNLVVNAAQAMPDGGRVELGVVEVSGDAAQGANAPPGRCVRFSVEDTGPGVPPELRARIFEPFFSTKQAGQNSGLGLSVVQGIVAQHQGYIALRETAHGGARFEVCLPVTHETEEVAPERRAARKEPTGKSAHVLLVEDEKMVRELTKRILAADGFAVTEAADADAALELAAQADFDLLLTDVVLPGLSGAELVARLRQQGHTFRVVYMSGYPADFVDARLQLAPDELLVQKPFTVATLLEALRDGALRDGAARDGVPRDGAGADGAGADGAGADGAARDGVLRDDAPRARVRHERKPPSAP